VRKTGEVDLSGPGGSATNLKKRARQLVGGKKKGFALVGWGKGRVTRCTVEQEQKHCVVPEKKNNRLSEEQNGKVLSVRRSRGNGGEGAGSVKRGRRSSYGGKRRVYYRIREGAVLCPSTTKKKAQAEGLRT